MRSRVAFNGEMTTRRAPRIRLIIKDARFAFLVSCFKIRECPLRFIQHTICNIHYLVSNNVTFINRS